MKTSSRLKKKLICPKPTKNSILFRLQLIQLKPFDYLPMAFCKKKKNRWMSCCKFLHPVLWEQITDWILKWLHIELAIHTILQIDFLMCLVVIGNVDLHSKWKYVSEYIIDALFESGYDVFLLWRPFNTLNIEIF